MPNNDDVNAILEQLRARTEQRLKQTSSPAPAASGDSAEDLLAQIRARSATNGTAASGTTAGAGANRAAQSSPAPAAGQTAEALTGAAPAAGETAAPSAAPKAAAEGSVGAAGQDLLRWAFENTTAIDQALLQQAEAAKAAGSTAAGSPLANGTAAGSAAVSSAAASGNAASGAAPSAAVQQTAPAPVSASTPAAQPIAPPQPEAKAKNSLPEPGIFAGLDSSFEEDPAAERERAQAERARLRQSRRAMLQKQQGGGKHGVLHAIGQVLLFLFLTALVILAVLYLLQVLADVQVIDVESLFDRGVTAILGGAG